MDNKNIKIVDEHNIDRDGTVIVSFNYEGNEYCVYKVSRDENNDNLFVSKLLNDVDGTSKLVNIDGENLKVELVSLVQKMITEAVNSTDDKSLTNVVVNGKNVSLLGNKVFNKEQNINVTKCYISTVSKAVTKVAGGYFDVAPIVKMADVEVNTPFVQVVEPVAVQPVIEEVKEDVLPVIEPTVKEPEIILPFATESVPVNEPVVEEVAAESVVTPVIDAENLNKEILPAVDSVVNVESVVMPEFKPITEEPKVDTAENIFEAQKTEVVNKEIAVSAVEPVNTIVEVPTVSNTEFVNPFASTVEDASEPMLEKTDVLPVFTPDVLSTSTVDSKLSVAELSPVQEAKIENNVDVTPEVTLSPEILTFDGSKESNLMQALGEVSSDKTIPVADIASVREFGVDEPKVSSGIAPMVAPTPEVTNQQVKTLTKSKGFVDNKFLMVIAIVLFVGACVFLGYEAFKFFSLK